MEIRGKHIGIIGAVRSGVGAAKLARRFGAVPFVTDMNPAEKLTDFLKPLSELGIAYETGGHSDRIYKSELVIVSPGVPSNAPVLKELTAKGIPFISEIEFASWFCKGTILAVTGTNGKTTTTSLLHHVISQSGRVCFAAGNIGFAFSEIAADVPEDGFVALEVSSFQLDTITEFRPAAAMILNITPDHLNRYNNNFAEYISSKHRITMNQQQGDILILNANDPVFSEYPVQTKARQFVFSMTEPVTDGVYLRMGKLVYVNGSKAEFTADTAQLRIKGAHNWQNAAAVIIAAKFAGIENEKLSQGLYSFEAVEHRLEPAGKIKGIEFVNDSKATNIDSVKVALKSFSTPVILILGGQDKGNNYDELFPLMGNVKKIYAIGSSAQKITGYFEGKIPVVYKKDLAECIAAGIEEGKEGDTVLLSPACASFDMFENYEHRGRVFKETVKELSL
ncbi:MAG: UDP-N-acetylmuramoyl-L-alanine--D-glutamate ligase [Ignavibacteriales bacterium]|nr:MAG: UDP-N-acetylmuramoyl-L-alanine--D-glutamate ligase [Ignavibacteriales bacterium]